MKYLILAILSLSVLSGSLAYASLSPLDASPNIPSLCKISNTTHVLSCAGIEDTFNMTGSNGIRVKLDNATKTITIVGVTPNTSQGTYNQTYANNALINSGGHRLNFINGTNSTISLVNDPSRNQINITISSTGGGGGGSGVSSVNALSGALTIACVAGNTTCTTSGGNTITINTAYNIATLNLNEIFSGITTMNNLKLGGQMNINGQTMQSFGHVYSWQNHTGTVCLTNQTTSCGPAGSATYDTLVNIGTGEASVYAGNTTKTNFDFKTLKQGSHITLTNNTNDVTISATGLLSNALLSINNDTTSAQTLKVIGSGSIADNGGGIHTITTKTYQNNTGGNLGTHGIGPFASMNAQVLQFLSLVSANSNCAFTNNSTNLILTCSTPPSINSVNSQTGPSISVIRQPGFTTVTNTTNTVKVGLDATGAMELNGTQTVTGGKTFTGSNIFTQQSNNFTNGAYFGHSTWLTDQGGSMEFGANPLNGINPVVGGAPYMDWHYGNGKAQDYNIRTQNVVNNTFRISNPTSGAIIDFGDGITNYVNQTINDKSILTTTFDLQQKAGAAISKELVLQPISGNTEGAITIAPSGTNRNVYFSLSRLPTFTTNLQYMLTGSDLSVTGEFFTSIRAFGTGTNIPWNIYQQNTKLFSFDPVNTITSYVQNIWTPITDPTKSFTNAIWKSSTNADVLKYRNNANTTTYNILSTLGAVTTATPADPTGTTSTTAKMMGLAGSITPAVSTRVDMTICGRMANSLINDGVTVQLRYGTGTAPTNGATLTGTQLGASQTLTEKVAAQADGYCVTGIATGLTIGTAYWMDVAVNAVTAGTASITGNTIKAHEV